MFILWFLSWTKVVSYEMFLYKVKEVDVFDANASGDEYTDCPGDGC